MKEIGKGRRKVVHTLIFFLEEEEEYDTGENQMKEIGKLGRKGRLRLFWFR